jgi:hypothetical protein
LGKIQDGEQQMTQEKKELKIVFAPGCFDNFDGTQEELQEMIAQIRQMASDGTLQEKSQPIDIDDEEFIKAMQNQMRPRQ